MSHQSSTALWGAPIRNWEGLTTKSTKDSEKGTKAQRHKGTKAQRHKGTKAHKILTKLAIFSRANPEESFNHGWGEECRVQSAEFREGRDRRAGARQLGMRN